MSSMPTPSVNLDEEFLAACLAISRQLVNDHRFLPTESIDPPTTFAFGKLSLSNNPALMPADDRGLPRVRLADTYPNAYSDFYGSHTPCVFKSGPDWYVPTGPQAQGIEREARPIYRHSIQHNWLSIGNDIYNNLDSLGVKWTSINPLAYADVGAAKPFCPLIISIGVMPDSLAYDAAVAAAAVVKDILTKAGFPEIEVAFVESVVTRAVTTGPKLLEFDPILDRIADLRKPFTPILGLSIAPLKYPHFEGTGGLYFRLSKDNNRIALLTCAHVARPPPVYPNTGMTRRNTSEPREEFVALGNMGYNNALNSMMATIGYLQDSIGAKNKVLAKLGEPVKGENTKVSETRKEGLEWVAKAGKKIQEVNALHTEVTKYRTTPDRRVIGFLLHSHKIAVGVKPDGFAHGFTQDWALIELYNDKIDWTTFMGNKVYVGGNMGMGDFGQTMFPQVIDRVDYWCPEDGLLQAYGIVQDHEMRDPQNLDIRNEKSLLVLKNGLATGTTVGRCNGLESYTRIYKEYGIHQTSVEFGVLPYDKAHGKFSACGDSGSVVLGRDGRIVGILTGGAGPTDETDITYLTPYWWVEQQIKAKFPGCFLYDVVA